MFKVRPDTTAVGMPTYLQGKLPE